MASLLPLCTATFKHWKGHRPGRLGAALSYYAVFSLVPLFIILLFIIGIAADRTTAQTTLIREVRMTIGHEGAEFAEMIMKNDSSKEKTSNAIATVVGIIILISGTTGVLGELKNSLDEIWEVQASTRRGLFLFIRKKAISFTIVPVLAFLVLLSLLVSAILTPMTGDIPFLTDNKILLELWNALFTFVTAGLLFAFIFRYIPDRTLHYTEICLGSAVTALLFIIGKTLIGVYLGMFAATGIYGAAGGMAIVMIWVYYSAQIFLIGASFTYIYSKTRGSLKNF